MMFKKALTKSGRRILRAIKKLSAPKSAKQQYLQQQQSAQPQEQQATWRLQTQLYFDDYSSVVSASLPSLLADAKSVDTFLTYVSPDSYEPYCCCCHCDEREENQRNENLENEMMR